MPLKAGLFDLSALQEANLLDSIEVSDAHVWDEESTTKVDGVPPLNCALDDLMPNTYQMDGQSRALMRHRSEYVTSGRFMGSGSGRPPSTSGYLNKCQPSSRGSGRTHAGSERHSTVAKQRPKQYKRPTASRFCHVCGRKSSNVAVAVCSRIEQGLCRKVVCEFCFDKYGWDREALDVAKRMQEKEGKDVEPLKGRKRVWECPHCLGKCVEKAQCNTYGKINYKRHLRLRSKRDGEWASSSGHRSNHS